MAGVPEGCQSQIHRNHPYPDDSADFDLAILFSCLAVTESAIILLFSFFPSQWDGASCETSLRLSDELPKLNIEVRTVISIN